MKHVAVVLTSSGQDRVATALQLVERLHGRGHRVSVFAHDTAVTLAAGTGEVPQAIAGLLRRSVHGAPLSWIVDEDAARRLGVLDSLVPGVVRGATPDLWRFVRSADVVLAPGACT